MKTIIIISGTPSETAEMELIEAEKIGYRRILCTDRPDEKLGQLADMHYLISFEDVAGLLQIAQAEKADGIISMSTKAMIMAATVCQILSLPGNSPESLENLISKTAFRKMMARTDVFCPDFVIPNTSDNLEEQCASLHLPIIAKPAQGSSSFGQTVVYEQRDLQSAYANAVATSWNGEAVIEDFIPQPSLCALELDVFVKGEDILWDGVRDSYRVEKAPLRPVYDVYPVGISNEMFKQMQYTVRALLKEAGVSLGEFNIEGYFTNTGEFFVIEINPRPAGYYNPQHIQLYSGVNLSKLLVTTAVGDDSYYESLKGFTRTRKHLLAYSVFSDRGGVLDYVYIDPSIQTKLIDQRYPLGRMEGCLVPDILTAIRPITILTFQFDTKEELESARRRIEALVYPVLMDEMQHTSRI